MKPNKRQSPGPERTGEREGGRGGEQQRPEMGGQDTAQGERLEKEREILGGEAGAGDEAGGSDVEREG